MPKKLPGLASREFLVKYAERDNVPRKPDRQDLEAVPFPVNPGGNDHGERGKPPDHDDRSATDERKGNSQQEHDRRGHQANIDEADLTGIQVC
jgi:hypothetical protein